MAKATNLVLVGRVLLQLSLLALFGSVVLASGCSINIKNQCPYKVDACIQSTPKGGPAGPINQVTIPSRTNHVLNLPTCSFPSGVIYASPTGQCANPAGSNSATAERSLINLMEFNIDGPGDDYYDLSLVDGYTIAQGIYPSNAACSGLTCNSITNIGAFCKGDNHLITYPTGAVTCANTDGHSPNVHSPTANTEMFKNACPQAYSYDYDDATSTANCPHGTNYEAVFCP